jgi:hypothetical protein
MDELQRLHKLGKEQERAKKLKEFSLAHLHAIDPSIIEQQGNKAKAPYLDIYYVMKKQSPKS